MEAVTESAYLRLWGNEQYPVLEALGDGWCLVAHPNGPAIARTEGWKYLGHLASSDSTDLVPASIRYAAVGALMQWAVKQPTWLKIKEAAK